MRQLRISHLPFLFACLWALALPGVAPADIIISNFSSTNDGDGSVIAASSGNLSKAAGFTMPAGSAYSLDSVTLRLQRNDASAKMQLDLFGDSGSNPVGPALVSFSIPAFSGTSNVVFTPMTAFSLQPLTTYWLAATGSSPTANGIVWLANSPAITPSGLATSTGYRFNSTGIYPPTGVSGVFNSYEVNGTALAAVPEPSSFVFLCLAVGVGVLGYRWRRPTAQPVTA